MLKNFTDEEGNELNPHERIQRPDDPRRCQAVTTKGQCVMVRIPDEQYCVAHGGQRSRRGGLKNYQLSKWKSRVQRFSDSDGIKSLRDEIGILRMMLEEKLNMVQDATELLCVSHAISDLVLKIERVVTSCHKIEKSMGDLIDRSVIATIADKLVLIIEDELKDVPNGQDILIQIADRMEPVLNETGRQGDDNDDEG